MCVHQFHNFASVCIVGIERTLTHSSQVELVNPAKNEVRTTMEDSSAFRKHLFYRLNVSRINTYGGKYPLSLIPAAVFENRS